jgi:general secretion pathway protein G
MQKRVLVISTALLLLIIIGWGVNKWIIMPRVKREFRETILKQNLRDMRKAIDQFAHDQRNLPQSLDDLVKHAYIREIPVDPITNRKDWAIEFEEATIDAESKHGIVDVSSTAPGLASAGIPYSDF